MNVLCTGVLGSGSSYLAEYIVSNHPEYNLYGCARWHSTGSNRNIESIKNKVNLIECDLTDLGCVIRMLEKIKPVKIFNLASTANVRICFENPLSVYLNNVVSTANLLEAVRMVCPNTIFQHCSTSEVFGIPKESPMTDFHHIIPVNPYAASKASQENLCYAWGQSWKLNIILSRAFAYINPKRHDLFATSFARQIVEIEKGKRKVLEHGNLNSTRTLIDVRDMVRAYWMLSEKGESLTPYNIGGIDVLTVGEFLDKLIEHAKCPIEHYVNNDLLRPKDVTNQVCDSSRFIKLTGFVPKYTLDDSIQWLLECCRDYIK